MVNRNRNFKPLHLKKETSLLKEEEGVVGSPTSSAAAEELKSCPQGPRCNQTLRICRSQELLEIRQKCVLATHMGRHHTPSQHGNVLIVLPKNAPGFQREFVRVKTDSCVSIELTLQKRVDVVIDVKF